MILLSDLNSEKLIYLKEKWSSETNELEREIDKTINRLTSKLTKQQMDQIQIDKLTSDLDNATELLQYLVDGESTPEAMISNQQALVDSLKKQINSEILGRNILTDEEAVLRQAEIDELELQKGYRENKIVEIEQILAAA